MYAEDFENLGQMGPQTPCTQTSSRPSLSMVPLTRRKRSIYTKLSNISVSHRNISDQYDYNSYHNKDHNYVD